MAVVTPLNNFLGPEGDTVTVPSPLLSPKSGRKMATSKYEKSRGSARRSTPRHPITMASTVEPPDPMQIMPH